MQVIVEEIISLFGLNYQPESFGDLFVWFVAVMASVCMVCGMIKLLLYMAVNVGRVMR